MFYRPTADILRDTRQFIGNWIAILFSLEDFTAQISINTTRIDLKEETDQFFHLLRNCNLIICQHYH